MAKLTLDLSVSPERALRQRAQVLHGRIDVRLDSDSPGVATQVHAARRHLKKLRALLRLASGRALTGEPRRQDHLLRAAARLLGEAREATVIATLCEQLVDQCELGPPVRERLSQLTTARSDAASAELSQSLPELRQQLSEIHPGSWSVAKRSWRRVGGAALERSYQLCRQRYRQLGKDMSAEQLHELRKELKYLRYQMQALAPAWPLRMAYESQQLKAMINAFGRDHDLYQLGQWLTAIAPEQLEAEVLERLEAEIKSSRQIARAKGLVDAKRYFALKPKLWQAQFEGAWP